MAAERQAAGGGGHSIPIDTVSQDRLYEDILVVEKKHVGGAGPRLSAWIWRGASSTAQMRRTEVRSCWKVGLTWVASASPKVSAKKLPALQHDMYQWRIVANSEQEAQ
jgi:hypothetical protein